MTDIEIWSLVWGLIVVLAVSLVIPYLEGFEK
jgi:hypothetical protein